MHFEIYQVLYNFMNYKNKTQLNKRPEQNRNITIFQEIGEIQEKLV